MNGVIGMTELLLDTELDRRAARVRRDRSRRSGEALLAIINDILDFSKIEAGKLELDAARFDLRELVEDVCALLAAAGRRRRAWSSSSRSTRRARRCCDGDRRAAAPGARQPPSRNAIKFTARGRDRRRRARRAGDGDGATRRASRSPTPASASRADALEPLFEPFSQADGSTTRTLRRHRPRPGDLEASWSS